LPGGDSICQPLVVSTITARSLPSGVQSAKRTFSNIGRGSPPEKGARAKVPRSMNVLTGAKISEFPGNVRDAA
jgi:hypothetical protein